MGNVGKGYGSQYHLRRLVNEFPEQLVNAVRVSYEKAGLPSPTSVKWISPLAAEGYRELGGMEYFRGDSKVYAKWAAFWPQTGTPPMWDAWGVASGSSWEDILLVEAKANASELESPPSGASPGSLMKILAALEATKAYLGVPRECEWHGTFYQFCNRLACLHFLNGIANKSARLLCVYFTGDRFPDGRPCPDSEASWGPLLERLQRILQLPDSHPYRDRILKAFIPVNCS